MLLHITECPKHKPEPPCYIRGLIVLSKDGPKFAYHDGLMIGEQRMVCGQDGCEHTIEVSRVDREACDFELDTLPVDVPHNGFFSAIDVDMKEIVQLLRNNGINTSCCCSHAIPAYIQFDILQMDDPWNVHMLLSTNGFRDYHVTTDLYFPIDGLPVHRGEISFNKWPK